MVAREIFMSFTNSPIPKFGLCRKFHWTTVLLYNFIAFAYTAEVNCNS